MQESLRPCTTAVMQVAKSFTSRGHCQTRAECIASCASAAFQQQSNSKQAGLQCLACRLLRLKLTDSKLSCIAAEFKAVPQLSEDLPPGTKVCCTNVSVKLGVLLLDSKSIQVNASFTACYRVVVGDQSCFSNVCGKSMWVHTALYRRGRR